MFIHAFYTGVIQVTCVPTLITLKKSSSLSVLRILLTVALAISILSPVILPLASSRITTSLGEVAAWMYLGTTEFASLIKVKVKVRVLSLDPKLALTTSQF